MPHGGGFGGGGAAAADLPPDAVRPVGTLHLTLGVMSLLPSRGGAVVGGGKEGGEEGDNAEGGLERAREVLARVGLKGVWRGVVEEWRARMKAQGRDVGGGNGGSGGLGVEAKAKGAHGGLGKGKEKQEEVPKITLRGLASMQPADRAAVLYAAPVDQFGLLQAFCERVRDVFKDAELMADEGRPLLLHATVVNTIYVRGQGKGNRGGRGRGGRGGRGRGGNKRERLVFDATYIIDRYEDQVWVEDIPLEKVVICKMGARKVVIGGEEDEAYEVVAEVAF